MGVSNIYTGPILFFDGVCGLCNHSVDFILQRDLREKIKFSPLQGQLANKLLPPHHTQDLRTLVLYEAENIYVKSEAVIRIGEHLGGKWKWMAKIGRWIPRGLRDLAYDLIARTRYKVFGKKATCRLPSPEERARFLD